MVMNLKFFTPALLASLLLVLPQCKKDAVERGDLYSPPTTNKVTCRINGQKWEANKIRTGFSIRTFDNREYYRLYAIKETEQGYESIEIYLNKPYSLKERKFNQATESWYHTAYPKDYGYFHRYTGWGNSETYITNAVDTGYCTITYMDSVGLRIKGVFAFTAKDDYTGKIIRITDGYFEGVQGK